MNGECISLSLSFSLINILLFCLASCRDRASRFWPQLSSYLLRVLKSTAVTSSQVLSERAISAIFRLAIRFIPRPDEMAEQVTNSSFLLVTTRYFFPLLHLLHLLHLFKFHSPLFHFFPSIYVRLLICYEKF